MKRLVSILAVLTSFALVPFMSGLAQAGAAQTDKTTGSILMTAAAQPTQYATFDAFQSNPVKGNFSYTNFDPASATVGSGVWVPTNFNLGFAVDPSTTVGATFAMTTTSFFPTSPTSVAFSGTGAVSPGASWLATFTGTVSSSSFHLAVTEINASNLSETYALFATGTVASGGSVSGTWYDNYGLGRTGTFTVDNLGYEAFHYSVPVAHVTYVGAPGKTAMFDIVVQGTGTSLDGTPIYFKVTDGGSPGAGNDTFGFSLSPGGPFANQTISGGNLTVFVY